MPSFQCSQVVNNNLNPTWKPFRIPVQSLCGGDMEKPIKVLWPASLSPPTPSLPHPPASWTNTTSTPSAIAGSLTQGCIVFLANYLSWSDLKCIIWFRVADYLLEITYCLACARTYTNTHTGTVIHTQASTYLGMCWVDMSTKASGNLNWYWPVNELPFLWIFNLRSEPMCLPAVLNM